MEEILSNVDWMQVIAALWTLVLAPILSYVGKQIYEWTKSKKID